MREVNRCFITAIVLSTLILAFPVGLSAQDASVTNQELVEQVTTAFVEGELDAIDTIVSPDFVLHDPLTGDIEGPDALKAFYSDWRTAMPNVFCPIEKMIVEGDRVAVLLPTWGTFSGPMFDIEPNGNEIYTTFINIWRVEDGQLVEAWYSYDTLDLMQQLNAPTAVSDLTAQEQANIAAHDRLAEEIYNDGNVDAIPDLFDPAYTSYLPGNLVLSGFPGVETFVDVSLTAFPDLHWVVIDREVSGDTVSAFITGYGTFEGEYLGIPPNGNRIQWPMHVTWRFTDEGKAIETRVFYDNEAFMQQLGALPVPELNIDPTVTSDTAELLFASWNEQNGEPPQFPNMTEDYISPGWMLRLGGNPNLVSMYGHAGWNAWASFFFAAYPDFAVTIDDLVVEDDLAVVRYTVTGTHTGEYPGVETLGNSIEVGGTNILRIVDGQNTEIWQSFDMLLLMQQMGAIEG